ncbi:MFS transporter [Prosthecobacter dejongeii]|uniref:ACS family tartrate transporter-like MFS transporter n=1 Tax=Prosthecobacter dejongeii TaxID=48465 RepID=A0A7W7YNS5_9BACT|nr:MFS transporter [Prosthecobacter dejongeii]MBB5039568.1 ACS family tartrate transporter-like MFS transporter [Prosthecobacter dejongeii]
MAADSTSPLDRARRKAFIRLLPVLFISYMIAYVDRVNVAVAKLTMMKDMPAFTDAVIGFGSSLFFIGYFLLEVPGTLMVERWSARKWICRIMVTWGMMAGLTAFVRTPVEFYTVRFLLGLAEAGFFPGVIVYLTHWFTSRDRAKALSYFLVATPFAQMLSPISNWVLKYGTTEVLANGETLVHPKLLGLVGWQWVYILWAIPAVVLGIGVLWLLTDRPRQATWLTQEERDALEAELERERQLKTKGKRMTLLEAFSHPKVLLLCAAYFFITTCSHSMELFMPSVIKDWYNVSRDQFTWLIVLPPLLALCGQLFGGWSSDRFQERRLHACIPIAIGGIAMLLAPLSHGNLFWTMVCLMVTFAGFKTYMPAFWSLPSLFLAEAAAAGSIGLINSVGNLGGAVGPSIIGWIKTNTGSYISGFYFLGSSMLIASLIVFFLGLGTRKPKSVEET